MEMLEKIYFLYNPLAPPFLSG